MKYKYKFSVIIPIYNVEEYLEEAIESVINQTLDFKDNIQMILVNDGSPDNSEEICLKYKELYPDNIIYIKQKNAGVSAARNKGLKYAQGKYINFLDSDDKWQENVFEKAYEMFETHRDIDVIACRIKYFEAKKGFNHPLNYKFTSDRIINVKKEPNMVQMHVASCFLRSKHLKGVSFSTKLKYAEDSLFVNTIILNKQKYGALRDAIYMYRKRFSENSALDIGNSNKSYYNDTLKGFHQEIQKLSIKKYKEVIPYIQYVCMYDIQWRLKKTVDKNTLSNNEILEYKAHIQKLLESIDDNVILDSRNIFTEHKLYALSLKYNRDIRNELIYKNEELFYKNRKVYYFSSPSLVKINVINIKKDEGQIAGQINCPLDLNKNKIIIEINGKREELKLEESPFIKREKIDGILYSNQLFNYSFDIKEINTIRFYIKYDDHMIKLSPIFTKNSKLYEKMNLFYKKNNLICFYKNKTIYFKNKASPFKMELRNYWYLLRHKKAKAIIFRLLTKILMNFKRKEIWLLSDRSNVANDNGMHLFKYINNQNNKKIKTYFCIDKKSKDFNKMKRYGKVLPLNSFKYKIKFLLSDKIISSQADEWVTNAFGKSEIFYRDLMTFDFVFLQHGITQNDLSGWLNYFNKNIKLFITSTQNEYDSIIKGSYFYNNFSVKLTGMPRYDNLNSKTEKMVTVMPTWRKELSGTIIKSKGHRKYNPGFKDSDYYKFYNNLINDDRLIECMKKNGYKGLFVIHPLHVDNYIDFIDNEVFKINRAYANYQDIFKKSNLLISDYSSVLFDFAYLHKPIIYTQFDKEDFFKNHTLEKGYFSYEDDGFGPVVYNYEDTVKEIIKFINNDCKLEKKYEKRIESFYAFHDRNNCKRVYEEILKIK